MRVLITQIRMDSWTGAELVVRDLGRALARKGHDVVVYSPRLGDLAARLRSEGMAIVSELKDIGPAPDVIHGHHHGPAMAALVRFRKTPGVFVCHDALSWVDEAPRFPRILRYVAVDELCRARLARQQWLPEDRIAVIHNAVDLDRFCPRGPLPPQPRRALVFSNNASEKTHLPAVRKACLRFGLQLDVVGERSRRRVEEPERILPQYDLVFAKARCALESMAVGCAVVLCDANGLGPMVTSDRFDKLRALNFGRGALVKAVEPELIAAEIARYDADDARVVSQKARQAADLADATLRWTELYEDVIQEHHQFGVDPDEEARAISEYLVRWGWDSRIAWEHDQLGKLRKIPGVSLLLNQFMGMRWRREAKRRLQ